MRILWTYSITAANGTRSRLAVTHSECATPSQAGDRQKQGRVGIFLFAAILCLGSDLSAVTPAVMIEVEDVIVYPSIAVSIDKSIVLQLPRRAMRISITQPQIADALVVAPDQILITGKAMGSTSLVVWFEPRKTP